MAMYDVNIALEFTRSLWVFNVHGTNQVQHSNCLYIHYDRRRVLPISVTYLITTLNLALKLRGREGM